MAPSSGFRSANQLAIIKGDRSNPKWQYMLARQERSFLQDVERAARAFAGVSIDGGSSGLTVSGSGRDGFNMSVVVEAGRYALYFDNWMEEVDSEQIARELFEAALRGDARLKVDLRGGRPWQWTLERLENGSWRTESAVNHVTWRFWGRDSTVYLRNTFPPLVLPPVDSTGKALRPN